MLNAISPYSSYNAYGAAYAARSAQPQDADRVQRSALVMTARKAPQPDTPVQPVTPVRSVDSREDPAQQGLLRFASDPAEMAVRMRIRQPGQEENAAGLQKGQAKDLAGPLKGQEDAAAPEGAQSPREVMEEGECQTCKERKYQDGSDDPGVSFKTPTNVAPEQAAAAVRGHENEHVVREQAKAQREDRKVVSQSVTYHTAICPECGEAYVSGGTTRTVTKAGDSQQADQQDQRQGDPKMPFSAVA